jgi:hypothetical protein
MFFVLACAACAAETDDFSVLPPEGMAIGKAGSGSEGGAAGMADPAPLYVITRVTTEHVNGLIRGVVQTVWDLARRGGGPVTPLLSPVTYRLVIADGAFHLDIKPKDAGDDAFQPLVHGAAGWFEANLDLGHALDPIDHPGTGVVRVLYGDGRIRLHHEDAGAAHDYAFDATPPADGGGGTFAFATPDGQIRSMWNATGAGRGELRAADGRIEIECWDASFARVACP